MGQSLSGADGAAAGSAKAQAKQAQAQAKAQRRNSHPLSQSGTGVPPIPLHHHDGHHDIEQDDANQHTRAQDQQDQQAKSGDLRHRSSTLLESLDCDTDDRTMVLLTSHRNSISNHTVATESTTPETIESEYSAEDEDEDFTDQVADNTADLETSSETPVAPSSPQPWAGDAHVGHLSAACTAGTASLAASLPAAALPGGALTSTPQRMSPFAPAKMAFGNAEVLVAASNGLVVGATPSISSSQKPHGQSGNPKFSDSEIPDWIRKYETVMGHVNQYVMFDRIGSGAQGSVYKCLNLKDKKIYAIKALEHASLRKRRKPGSSINSLKNEIGIMKMLDHPNLVKLYEVIDDLENDRLYLVIDYVQGGGVMGDHDLMKGGPELAIPEERAQMLFGDFVRGMEYLHNHGVLHRDIKPSNMLIDNNTEDGEPRVKVCDFGVSSLCNQEKSAKVLGEDDLIYVAGFGTVAMMSPEALGRGPDAIYHGRPADVWAAGVTLYCMVTGTLPWRAKDADSLQKEICSGSPVNFPPRPRLSKEVRRLISKMLELDPNQRITFSLIRQEPWLLNGHASGHSSRSVSERLESLAAISSSTSWSSGSPSPVAGAPSHSLSGPASATHSSGQSLASMTASAATYSSSKSVTQSQGNGADEEDRIGESTSGGSANSNGSPSSGSLLDSFRRSNRHHKARSARIGSIKMPRDTWLANVQAVLAATHPNSKKNGPHSSSSSAHQPRRHESSSAPDLPVAGSAERPSTTTPPAVTANGVSSPSSMPEPGDAVHHSSSIGSTGSSSNATNGSSAYSGALERGVGTPPLAPSSPSPSPSPPLVPQQSVVSNKARITPP